MDGEDAQRAQIESELIAIVEKLVENSGDRKDFDANAWVTDWLAMPNPALGGRMPNAFLDTKEGKELVISLIMRMQSGAFS